MHLPDNLLACGRSFPILHVATTRFHHALGHAVQVNIAERLVKCVAPKPPSPRPPKSDPLSLDSISLNRRTVSQPVWSFTLSLRRCFSAEIQRSQCLSSQLEANFQVSPLDTCRPDRTIHVTVGRDHCPTRDGAPPGSILRRGFFDVLIVYNK